MDRGTKVAQLVGGIHDLGRQALFSRFDDSGPRSASYLALLAGVVVGATAAQAIATARAAGATGTGTRQHLDTVPQPSG